jgi:TRAP-type C4-dicarboxylate transport system permease small subunit
MSLVIWLTLIAFGGAAGWLGWHNATRAAYRRSYGRSDAPLGQDKRTYEIATIARRKRWRIVVTALYTAGGVLVGLVFLLLISAQR